MNFIILIHPVAIYTHNHLLILIKPQKRKLRALVLILGSVIYLIIIQPYFGRIASWQGNLPRLPESLFVKSTKHLLIIAC